MHPISIPSSHLTWMDEFLGLILPMDNIKVRYIPAHVCVCVCVCMCVLVVRSCHPLDQSSPGSSVHEIFQARILGWVDISFSRESPDPGTEPTSLLSPALTDEYFTTVSPGKPTWIIWEEKKHTDCFKWDVRIKRDDIFSWCPQLRHPQ